MVIHMARYGAVESEAVNKVVHKDKSEDFEVQSSSFTADSTFAFTSKLFPVNCF